MKHSRREFLGAAALVGASPVLARLDSFARLAPAQDGRAVFIHGIASGDPLADRVVLWTRVSGASGRTSVRWEVADDESFTRTVRRGEVATDASRDFTVKVDASGLRPGRQYFYRFTARGERSPEGRTRTLATGGIERVRMAVASCSNLPVGYFNAYRGIAARDDLDLVLHLGDYIYEYANRRYGDGSRFGRIPQPDHEIVSLDDYRTRHAQYKTDPDLQEAHRLHPWITVWDDHEIANNTWRDGAQNHNPDQGEGDWATRRAAAVRAYREWMPIREDARVRGDRIYRTFRIGGMADLLMLDTRLIGRDPQAVRTRVEVIEDPRRSLLGRAQEEWLFSELRRSKTREARWHVLGQQVMFAPMSPAGQPAGNADAWDGYRPSRDRIVDFLAAEGMKNAVVLTGDVHSSWAYDIARDPWSGYDRSTGRGTTAVEFVAPSVTSPSGWTAETAAKRLADMKAARPHLHWADGLSHGYVMLNLSREAVQADWISVATIDERTSEERFEKGYVSEHGNPRLVEAESPAE